MKTVAIVGGGFSGTMTAVNLARFSDHKIRIVLVNARHPAGRGVAYGTRRSEHLLNVAARNMSAVPDHPQHFLDWLRTRSEYSDLPDAQLRETYAPRRVYGDYVRSLLHNYCKPIDAHHASGIELVDGEVVDIQPVEGDVVELILADGGTVTADRVLLATGNQPPARLCGENGEPFSHAAFAADPWCPWQDQLPDPQSDIVVLGTGLTMVDVFLTLSELNWQGKIVAVSRSGMIPQAHFRGIEFPDFLPEKPEQAGLQALVELVEKNCEQLRRIGENPGIVVDRFRPHTQRIWQNLTREEKQEFLSRYAAKWNVIRHRIPQPIHQRLTEAITTGQVRVVRGNISSLVEVGERVGVRVRDHQNEETTIEGGLVINCTGPNAGFSDSDVPLFANLMRRGQIRPDELNMGIEVGPDFAVIDSDGNNSNTLFAIGPLMKGSLWETTAVPELRGQAMRVAELMLEAVTDEVVGRDYRLSVEEEHVIEYFI